MTATLPLPATTRRAFARRLIARRRRGISLFQVLMGLALFAATLIGAVQLYNSATETQRRNDAQALLTTLTVAVSQIWQGVVDGCIERRDFGDLPRFVRVVFLPCCQVLLSRPVVVV